MSQGTRAALAWPPGYSFGAQRTDEQVKLGKFQAWQQPVMSGGHDKAGGKAIGESRRFGSGVDMSAVDISRLYEEGNHASLLGGLQHYKQPRYHSTLCPVTLWHKNVWLPAAGLCRAQAEFKAGACGQGLARKT